MAGIVCLTSVRGLGETWASIFSLTYLYYVLSAGIAVVILGFGIHWNGAYRSFHVYFITMSSTLVPKMASAGD